MNKNKNAKLAVLLIFGCILAMLLPACTQRDNDIEGSQLLAFEYFYTDEEIHQYRVFYDAQNPEQVLLYSGRGSNHFDEVGIVLLGDHSVLDGIETIIQENGIAEWDGINDTPTFSASTQLFHISAIYDNVVLNAQSNIEGIPEAYHQGHDAIVRYLDECVENLPRRELSLDDFVSEIYIRLSQEELMQYWAGGLRSSGQVMAGSDPKPITQLQQDIIDQMSLRLMELVNHEEVKHGTTNTEDVWAIIRVGVEFSGVTHEGYINREIAYSLTLPLNDYADDAEYFESIIHDFQSHLGQQ